MYDNAYNAYDYNLSSGGGRRLLQCLIRRAQSTIKMNKKNKKKGRQKTVNGSGERKSAGGTPSNQLIAFHRA